MEFCYGQYHLQVNLSARGAENLLFRRSLGKRESWTPQHRAKFPIS